MSERLRVVFFGEPSSTFSLVHYATLCQSTEVVLWVASQQNKPETAKRARFSSCRDWVQRARVRLYLERKALALLGFLPSRIRIKCPIERMSRGGGALGTRLAELGPDIFVSAGFRRIIPGAMLESASMGAYNCHPSPLPQYAGSNPWFWMLKHGEQQGGVTIHRMVAQVDAGEIVLQERFQIPRTANHQWLYNESSLISAKLLKRAIMNIGAGTVRFQVQDHSKRTIFSAPTDDDYRIDWGTSAYAVINLVRASSPFPGAWTTAKGVRFSIREAALGIGRGARAGLVLDAGGNNLVVGCGEESVCIRAGVVDGRQLNGALLARVLNLTPGDLLA